MCWTVTRIIWNNSFGPEVKNNYSWDQQWYFHAIMNVYYYYYYLNDLKRAGTQGIHFWEFLLTIVKPWSYTTFFTTQSRSWNSYFIYIHIHIYVYFMNIHVNICHKIHILSELKKYLFEETNFFLPFWGCSCFFTHRKSFSEGESQEKCINMNRWV